MIGDELHITRRSTPLAEILDLDGNVTMFAEQQLRHAYQQLCDSGAERLVINFQRSDYINSAGLAVLIGIATDARQRRQQLALCGLTPHFQKIFRMVGLGRYALIHGDEQEALDALRRDAADGANDGRMA